MLVNNLKNEEAINTVNNYKLTLATYSYLRKDLTNTFWGNGLRIKIRLIRPHNYSTSYHVTLLNNMHFP